MTDSSVPLWDSEEENGLTALTLRRMSWEALIETGTLPGHAALGVQDHEAGEATVDLINPASTLVTTPDRGMAVSSSIILVLVILVNAERISIR